eukprot:Tbor_TRINITY_DN3345_c0_g1::TRINITY_DN3345_c0_g1_i1::g.23447::m.23447
MKRICFVSAISAFRTVVTCGSRSACTSSLWNLTEEQKSFSNLAKVFAEKELFPNASKWDEDKIFPKECLLACASQGFAGIYCPTESGGAGLTRMDASLIFEQLAMADPSTTAYLTIHNMCAWMVGSFGCTSIKNDIAEKLCSMDLFASYCLTEPSSGSDAASLKTTAKDMGDYYLVNGAKAFISGGGASDVYVTMVRTGVDGPSGISCLAIYKTDSGVSFGKNERKLGWNSQPTCSVSFDNVKVPKTRIIGAEGEGFRIAMKGLNGGRINIATCSLGAAQHCLDLAVRYAKDRYQFSKPISSFQNTQFKLAEMAADVHCSRLMIRQAAEALDRNDVNANVYCAMAKMHATEKCFEVCDQSLQIHGGYGYLRDFPIERYLRDLRVHRILEGTNEVMRMIVSRDLIDGK